MPILRQKVISEPVADLTALKALDDSLMVDGVVVNVVGLAFFKLDKTSSFISDDNLVVTPHSGVGKWLNISNWSGTPTETLGGIVGGVAISNTPVPLILSKLLIKYQAPAFTAFGISGQANPLELGDSISGAKTFTWATSNSAEVATDSINIYKDITGVPTIIVSGVANTGSRVYTFPSPIQLTDTGSYVFRIECTDKNTPPAQHTRDATFNWYPRKFWGTNANATLTEAMIKALVSQTLSNATAGTYSFGAAVGQYKHFAFEASLPQPNYLEDFKDQTTGLGVAMAPPYTVSVANSFGVTKDYVIYRTFNQPGGAVTIIVSN